MDEKREREILAHNLPKPDANKWLWIGIDARSMARPEAVPSADRTAQHVQTLPEWKKPITCGWHCSTVVALANPARSGTSLLDHHRVTSQTTAIQGAEAQRRRVVPHLPIVVVDRGSDANGWWCRWSAVSSGVLGRLKSNRCLYRPAPAPTGKKGSPRNDGAKRHPKDPTTHGEPAGMWKGTDAKGRPVDVSSWKHMPVTQARWLEVTVLWVVRPHATNKERDPRVSWCVWRGDQEADVLQIAPGSVLRFGQEHGYRFDTHALLWETPRVRTPEQCERWSHIVAMAHTHLVLARDLVEAERRPWENKQRKPTPQHVRRGMDTLLARLGTPARPPHPRGTSKGRSIGAKVKKAERLAVIRNIPTVPHIVPSERHF